MATPKQNFQILVDGFLSYKTYKIDKNLSVDTLRRLYIFLAKKVLPRMVILYWGGYMSSQYVKTVHIGAGGGSRTRVSALGRLHNGRYTTPAYNLWSHLGDSNPRPPLYESGALAN